MRARPIRTRDDLLAALKPYCPTRACEKALMTLGGAIVLGGFAPPGDLPGWIVEVTARQGQRWYIGLVCDKAKREMRIRWYGHGLTPLVEDKKLVPWAYWTGKADGRRPLTDGDIPQVMGLRRQEAINYENNNL